MRLHSTISITALAAMLLATSGAAQEPLDFSGHWTAATPQGGGRGGPASDPGSGWGSEFTIIQRGGTLTVERAFFSAGDLQPPLKFDYALDGSPTRNTVLMGRGAQDQLSTASWDGATLVIVTRHTDPGAPAGRGSSEVRHTLSFQPSARVAHPPSLVIETMRSGAHSPTRTVYGRG